MRRARHVPRSRLGRSEPPSPPSSARDELPNLISSELNDIRGLKGRKRVDPDVSRGSDVPFCRGRPGSGAGYREGRGLRIPCFSLTLVG